MSKKQPPRVLFDFEEDTPPPAMKLELKDDFDIDVIDNLDDEDELEMPRVVGKPKVEEDEIFADLPPKNKKQVVEPKVICDEPKVICDEDIIEKPKKQRKPMSEEHKQKLALAREKAMAVRKAKAEEKKQMKEIENQTNQLKKIKKVKELEELKDEVESKTTEKPQKVQIHSGLSQITSGLTKEDLEQAQYDAIVKYETLRKQRKAEKKRQEQIEADKQHIMNQIKQPIGYRYRDGSNKWDMCY